MLKTLVVLPSGDELFSGPGSVNAIQSISIEESVNDSNELNLGSTCATSVDLTIVAPKGIFGLSQGDEIALFAIAEDDTREQRGIFIVEKPERSSANTYKVTAYDRVSKLDKDLTSWLSNLKEWPYSLIDLVKLACVECGVILSNDSIPNGNYPVQRFSAEGITGRQIVQWAGQISGRFCRATPEGLLEFAWYTFEDTLSLGTSPEYPIKTSDDGDGNLSVTCPEISVSDDGNLNVFVDSTLLEVSDDSMGNVKVLFPSQTYFYQGTLQYADYEVYPIEKVQLKNSEDDVGTIWPNTVGELNTYIISGNYLLTADTSEALLPVAQTLYAQLKDVSYRPCSVTIPECLSIRAGDIITVTDKNGFSFSTYVMKKSTSGHRDNLECLGSYRRDSTTAVNHQSYKALSGKVLNLSTTVEGLKIEHADTAGNVATLELNLKNITSRVESTEKTESTLEGRVSTVEQTAQGITVSVSSISTALETKADKTDVQEITEHFIFAEDGMTIKNSATGMGIGVSEQRVIFTGGDDPTTEIYPDRMETTDLKVGEQLDIGPFSWFPRSNGNLSLRYIGKGQ